MATIQIDHQFRTKIIPLATTVRKHRKNAKVVCSQMAIFDRSKFGGKNPPVSSRASESRRVSIASLFM